MIDVSICIVSLNADSFLEQCLDSIPDSMEGEKQEVIIVDNGSTDRTVRMLEEKYSAVKVIKNTENEGFARPINRAIKESSGRYILVLNPDTVLLPNCLHLMVEYLDKHPDIGICGPKVLNEDKTFQKSCRRGIARPWNVFTYFTGLSALFPKNKIFTGYHLSHIDENIHHEVDGVSGSCMLIRRGVIDSIGLFDETFFAYQEDSDFCFRAKANGWKIFYYPAAQIIHYGGQGGSETFPYRSIYEWHRSYFLLYRKHFASEYPGLFNLFYYLLMLPKLFISVLVYTIRRFTHF